MWKIVNEMYPTTCVLGSCVAIIETERTSGRYSEQMHGRNPHSLTADQQQLRFLCAGETKKAKFIDKCR